MTGKVFWGGEGQPEERLSTGLTVRRIENTRRQFYVTYCKHWCRRGDLNPHEVALTGF